MAIELHVFLTLSSMPTMQLWQSRIDAADVGLVLDGEIDIARHSGYLPAVLGSHPSGFEFYGGGIADLFGGQVPAEAGSCDHVATFVTGSDFVELKCAMFAAGALADLSGGILMDPQAGEVISVESCLTEAAGL